MSTYPLTVTDRLASELAGHPELSDRSGPQPREDALARAFTGLPELPDDHGAWRHGRPGETRTVRIELAR